MADLGRAPYAQGYYSRKDREDAIMEEPLSTWTRYVNSRTVFLVIRSSFQDAYHLIYISRLGGATNSSEGALLWMPNNQTCQMDENHPRMVISIRVQKDWPPSPLVPSHHAYNYGFLHSLVGSRVQCEFWLLPLILTKPLQWVIQAIGKMVSRAKFPRMEVGIWLIHDQPL